MKTRILSIILTLALLLSALAGCGKSEDPAKPDGQPETEADYSWFSMPEETGKLVLYTTERYGSLYDPAIRVFQEKYPEIEVSCRTYGEDECQTVLRAEVPAGGGPDLVLFQSSTFPDIYKTMQTGLFEDLNPYFAVDDEIALSEFLGPVMDGGVFGGERLVIPLNYDVPLIMTTESILAELGMSAEDLKTCDGFCEGAARFHEKYPDTTLFFDMAQAYSPYLYDIRTLYKNFGFQFIDFEAGEVDIDEARFRQCMDLVKLFYDPDYDGSDMSKWDIYGYSAGEGLNQRFFMYDDCSATDFMSCNNSRQYLNSVGEEPVFFLQSDQHDGVTAEMKFCAAIPKASHNKAAAWKFLKILLSDEIQGGHDKNNANAVYLQIGFPVRLSAFRSALDYGNELTPVGPEMDAFTELVQSPTQALMIPQVYRQFIDEHMMPYIRGEKPWDDCYKKFLGAVELYKDE